MNFNLTTPIHLQVGNAVPLQQSSQNSIRHQSIWRDKIAAEAHLSANHTLTELGELGQFRLWESENSNGARSESIAASQPFAYP